MARHISEVFRNMLVEIALGADSVEERIVRLAILLRDEHISVAEHLMLVAIASSHEDIGSFDE